MKFSKAAIERLEYDRKNKERCVFWDDEVGGFGLRVYPSGGKSFILDCRFRGKKKLRTIGQFPYMSYQEARATAKLWKLNKKYRSLIEIRREKERHLLNRMIHFQNEYHKFKRLYNELAERNCELRDLLDKNTIRYE